jgi:hypothetical protein
MALLCILQIMTFAVSLVFGILALSLTSPDGDNDIASRLITLADMPVIRNWTESLWGSERPYVNPEPVPVYK